MPDSSSETQRIADARLNTTPVVKTPEDIFWECLRGCGAFLHRSTVKWDHTAAGKAWARISQYNLDAGRVATLINAAWRYAQARWLREGHRRMRRGELDKTAGMTIKDLAAQCERLERSIRQALQDDVTRHWLRAKIPSRDDDLVRTLPDLLKQAARAMRKIPPDQSQASITLRMRRDALDEMVKAVAPSGRNVPWAAMARIVNLMGTSKDSTTPNDPYGYLVSVAAKDLSLEYSRPR